eukprot:3723615-Rhodomonas_salina.2
MRRCVHAQAAELERGKRSRRLCDRIKPLSALADALSPSLTPLAHTIAALDQTVKRAELEMDRARRAVGERQTEVQSLCADAQGRNALACAVQERDAARARLCVSAREHAAELHKVLLRVRECLQPEGGGGGAVRGEEEGWGGVEDGVRACRERGERVRSELRDAKQSLRALAGCGGEMDDGADGQRLVAELLRVDQQAVGSVAAAAAAAAAAADDDHHHHHHRHDRSAAALKRWREWMQEGSEGQAVVARKFQAMLLCITDMEQMVRGKCAANDMELALKRGLRAVKEAREASDRTDRTEMLHACAQIVSVGDREAAECGELEAVLRGAWAARNKMKEE